jgi:hypothetical protein
MVMDVEELEDHGESRTGTIKYELLMGDWLSLVQNCKDDTRLCFVSLLKMAFVTYNSLDSVVRPRSHLFEGFFVLLKNNLLYTRQILFIYFIE